MSHIDQRHSIEPISPTPANFAGRDRDPSHAIRNTAIETIQAFGSIRSTAIVDIKAILNSAIEATRTIGPNGAMGAIEAIRNRAYTAISASEAIQTFGSTENIEAIRNAAIEAIRNAAIEASHEINDAAIKAGSCQSA